MRKEYNLNVRGENDVSEHKLKSCPFCGIDPTPLKDRRYDEDPMYYMRHRAGCFFSASGYNQVKYVISDEAKAWNRRVK